MEGLAVLTRIPTTLRPVCRVATTKADRVTLTDAGTRPPALLADPGRAAAPPAAAAPPGFLPFTASCTISSSFLRFASSMQDSALSMLDRLPAWQWLRRITDSRSQTTGCRQQVADMTKKSSTRVLTALPLTVLPHM